MRIRTDVHTIFDRSSSRSILLFVVQLPVILLLLWTCRSSNNNIIISCNAEKLFLSSSLLPHATTTTTTTSAAMDDLVDHSLLESFLLPTSSSSSSFMNDFIQYSGYLNGTNPQYGCCGCINRNDDVDEDEEEEEDHSHRTPEICQLHYWLIIEKENVNDETSMIPSWDKPMIVWFNGGPGASSIIGLLQEVGPFLITSVDSDNDIDSNSDSRNNNNKNNSRGTQNPPLLSRPKLILNPYRWTQMAHLLVIENPVGVGYSYCHDEGTTSTTTNHTTTTTTSVEPCYNNDNTTAQMTLYALLDFYINKLPTFLPPTTNHHNNKNTNTTTHPPLYLIGESYAGVYIPTLTNAIVQYNHRLQHEQQQPRVDVSTTMTILPLRGIAVGDPCTDNSAQSPYMDPLWYAHQYGLVDDAIYTTISNSTMCRMYYQQQEQQRRYHDALQSLDSNIPSIPNDDHDDQDNNITLVDDECRLAYRKYLFSSSRGISAYKNWNYSYIDRYSLYGFVTPEINRRTELFMNHPLVRQALHIPEFVYQSDMKSYWKVHSTSDTMIYTKLYYACNHRNTQKDVPVSLYTSMIDIYRTILPQLPDGALIYNGNTDPAISYEGTRTAVKAMGYPEIDGGSYRPWFYNHTNTSLSFLQMKSILYGTDHLVSHDTVGIQLGGYVTNYAILPSTSDGCNVSRPLSFVTIHGSGHLVPQNRPQSSYHMIYKFIQSGKHCHCIDSSSLSSMMENATVGVNRRRTHNQPLQPVHCLLPLSPLLPSNASLLAIKNDTVLLQQAINDWTLLAKSSNYVL